MNTPSKRTAIGYCRLSKKHEKSVSIEYQISAIQKLAKAHSLELVGIEIDNNISGKSIKNRPAVNRLIQLVKSRSIDAVLVYRSDRLSRNGIEGLKLEELMREHDVEYRSYSEGLLAGGLMSYVRNGINEEERKKISERTKIAIATKREKGEMVGGQRGYGLRLRNGKVEAVESEMEFITIIMSLHKKHNLSVRKITDSINSAGFRTRKGTPFSHMQIHRILKAA